MAQYKLLSMQHSTHILMWSITHFPSAMRSLNPSVRAKAIEIANQLLEQGKLDKQSVVMHSVDEARRWARCERSDQQWSVGNVQRYV
ncbi:hypothetical protein SAMN05216167_10825 [Spirosoma endophyticum]|uniref:DUF2188 domain-containing protein n=2 Tax=Spirosoma endophyticum TaxID=662367 RepID=A0A1I1VX77_9BACT|nr:hypothetical protein SAMN05216167_10825 [Spirosoma endophyticum]